MHVVSCAVHRRLLYMFHRPEGMHTVLLWRQSRQEHRSSGLQCTLVWTPGHHARCDSPLQVLTYFVSEGRLLHRSQGAEQQPPQPAASTASAAKVCLHAACCSDALQACLDNLVYINGEAQADANDLTTPLAGSYSSRWTGCTRRSSGLRGPANRRSCCSSRFSICGRPTIAGRASTCGAGAHSRGGTCTGAQYEHGKSLVSLCASHF